MNTVIFPGQGAQFRGMGKELFPMFPQLTKRASEILGYSIEKLCLEDTDNQLRITQYTQPALYVVNALGYYKKREEKGAAALSVDFLAGHSLGEYNALLAADVFSFETGLELVQKRGQLMGAASGGGMAAIIGMRAEQVQDLLRDRQLTGIDLANFNTPTQLVVAGTKAAILEAETTFTNEGVRYVVLNVSAPFHSRYMKEAQSVFAEFLQKFSFSAPKIPVIANVTARPYENEKIPQTLSDQIAGAVQWTDSIRYLTGQGEMTYTEIGSNILSKMVAEIQKTEAPIVIQPPHTPTDDTQYGTGIKAHALGSKIFRDRFKLKYAYVAGAMYRGIASAELVIQMGKAGFIGFFGTGGLSLHEIEKGIQSIKNGLSEGAPYGMNLLANYMNPSFERDTVDLYLKHGVQCIEASAFMQMTSALVLYRLKGLRRTKEGKVTCDHRIIAKLSRPEVAEAFMSPVPAHIVLQLLNEGCITAEQAELAHHIPMSHDICVEADSGGHTDGGIASVLFPTMIRLKQSLSKKYEYQEPICMGFAGGIGTPEAAAAAFLMGADFILTGSINQCTLEAGTSDSAKDLLQDINVQDTDYAPAGDMFEMGSKVQVLKKGIFFPVRANKLHSLYTHYNSLDEIPEKTCKQLENSYFKKTLGEIWQDTKRYLEKQGRMHEIKKAEENTKYKMALVFKWYFGYSTRIAMEGGEDKVNYQVHTGPALGAFNQWVKGTALESWRNRHADDIGKKLMGETAEYLNRQFEMFANPMPALECA